jgi:hypothetical protein
MEKSLKTIIKIGQTTIKINRLFIGKKSLEKLIERSILSEK